MSDIHFMLCEKCGKRLIERKANGMFKFVFGGKSNPPAVEMYIVGSIKMRCLRKSCGHWTEMNFLPNVFE